MTSVALGVLEGDALKPGVMNTPPAAILANVKAAIRRGHPQVWRQQPNADRVCLVAGGPSLESTFNELRDLVFAGAKLVTVNGAYQWCLDRNLKPSAQIVLDARAEMAAFVSPAVPGCRYYLASQCHPATWDAVEGRPFVGIFHSVGGDDHTDPIEAVLNTYYAGNWQGVGGGTTVTTRAIGLLRALGYLRYDLFGVDSCWLGGLHHAYAQPLNDRDRRLRVTASPSDDPNHKRQFECAPWHIKQAEDVLAFIKMAGHLFQLNVHGDGLIAYLLRESAALAVEE